MGGSALARVALPADSEQMALTDLELAVDPFSGKGAQEVGDYYRAHGRVE